MTASRRLAAPLAVGLAVSAYVWAWRRYGIYDVADEGVLLMQAWRTAHGQAPYLDFHTGYGPLYFRVQGWLVAAGGLAAVRAALAVVHGASAALLFALARRVSGAALALAAVALYVAFFLPVAPAEGAPFNLPYPAWYAGLGGLAIAAGLGGGVVSAAGAGVVAGILVAVKQNSGALLLVGAALAIALEGVPSGVTRLIRGLAIVAALALVAPSGLSTTALVLVPPVMALAIAAPSGGVPVPRTHRRMGALLAGFVPVAAVGLLPTLVRLGAERFGREVLLLGAGVADLYASPMPASAVAVGVAAGLALLVARRWQWALLVVAVGAAGWMALGATQSGDSLAQALRHAGEAGALALVPLVLWRALGAVRQGAYQVAAPVALAGLAALQLYPRADFEHLAAVAPLFLALAVHLWREALATLGLDKRPLALVACGVPLAVAAGRAAPTATLLAHVVAGQVERVQLGTTPLEIAPVGAPRLRNLAAVVEAVAAASRPDEAVLAFPACALVTFFSDRPPLGAHDYYFPGRPTRAEVAEEVTRLGAAPPRLAVTCRAPGSAIERAWSYYPEMVDFLVARYRVRLAGEPFELREADGR